MPGLNGLRAIAALLVLFHHMSEGLTRFGLSEPAILKFFFNDSSSRHAVNFFFVISGFLITYLLLVEKHELGSISLKKFYIRRSLRIFPLYYGYLFLIIAISLVQNYTSAYPSFFYYAFFAGNVANSGFFFINHYWSLGVEEQFYLVWPAFIYFFKRGQLWVIFSAILILTAACFIQAIYKTSHPFMIFIAKSRFQCLMIGGMGAFAFIKNYALLKVCYNKGVQAACLLLLALMLLGLVNPYFFKDEICSITILIILVALINSKSHFLQLENRVLNYLGKISFGIYVIHPLIMWLLLRVFKKIWIPQEFLLWAICLLTTVLTIVAAALSYKYFEQRFLKLKKSFVVVRTSNTPTSSKILSATTA